MSAASGLATNSISKGTKNFFRSYANLILGVDQSEAFSRSLKESVFGVKKLKRGKTALTKTGKTRYTQAPKGLHDIKGSFKTAFKDSEKAIIDPKTGKAKSVWRAIADSFKSVPGEFNALGKEAKFGSKLWKGLGILGKRVPFILNVVGIAMALPTIFRAFSDGGAGAGVAEIGKEGAKIGAFAAGAAIGQALIPIPFVGGLIGGAVAGWLAGKITGKSYIEKQEEAAQNTAGNNETSNETTEEIDNNEDLTEQEKLTQKLLAGSPSFTGAEDDSGTTDYQSLIMGSSIFDKGNFAEQDFMGSNFSFDKNKKMWVTA